MSSGYLVERQLEDLIILPLSLPVTKIEPNSELTISVLQLTSASQRLKHPFMQIKVVARDPTTPSSPTRVDDRVDVSHGYAFGAIYDKNGLLLSGSKTEISSIGSLTPPMVARLAVALTPVSGPSLGTDEYTYRVVNNCQDITLDLIATGVWKVDLNAV